MSKFDVDDEYYKTADDEWLLEKLKYEKKNLRFYKSMISESTDNIQKCIIALKSKHPDLIIDDDYNVLIS